MISNLIGVVLPIGVVIFFMVMMMRQNGGGGGKMMDLSRSFAVVKSECGRAGSAAAQSYAALHYRFLSAGRPAENPGEQCQPVQQPGAAAVFCRIRRKHSDRSAYLSCYLCGFCMLRRAYGRKGIVDLRLGAVALSRR